MSAHFGTVSVEPTVPVLLTAKPLETSQKLNFWKIGICFGNQPFANFFHDQTIFIKDCEHYTIGHHCLAEPGYDEIPSKL